MGKAQQRQNPGHTKDDILNSAEKLFSEKGFDGTGIMEIARDAGVPKSLIYYYFKSKEEILNELVSRFVHELVELKKSVSADADPEQMLTSGGLRWLLETLYEFVDERKAIYRIMYQEGLKREFIGNFLMNVQFSQQASIEYFKNAGMTVLEKDMKLGHFFLIAMPFMSFILYKDMWCKLNDYERDEAREKFFDMIVDIMTLIVTRSVSRP